MIETPRNERQESIPNDLEIVPLPEDESEIHWRISRKLTPNEPGHKEWGDMGRVVDGFEDILHEPIGVGLFYNHPTSEHQLSFALSISPHPAIRSFLADKKMGPAEIIRTLRENQVLSGFKIIDLGCGRFPYFALAVHALGAKVYTTDIEGLSQEDSAGIERHIVINLNQENALEMLQDSTGSDFDIVSENIIDTTPTTRRNVTKPKSERIVQIGSALLKKGGYLYHTMGVPGLPKTVLRKR